MAEVEAGVGGSGPRVEPWPKEGPNVLGSLRRGSGKLLQYSYL